MQVQLDTEQTKREEAEVVRMYDLLEKKLIEYRDISEDTCHVQDIKVSSFSKAVRPVHRTLCRFTFLPRGDGPMRKHGT